MQAIRFLGMEAIMLAGPGRATCGILTRNRKSWMELRVERMAHTVFICHSSNDKQVADAACAALEAQRIPCWIAPRDILAGEEYGKAIVDALASCQIVLLIFSGHANDSPQVRREIERAVSKGKIIVPFRIEDVMPSDAMEFALSNTHWLNALTPPLERYLLQLCDTISRLMQKHIDAEPPLWRPQEPVKETVVKPEPIAKSAKVSPEPVNEDVKPRTRAPWWKKRSAIAGAALVSILIVVTLSISFHRIRQTGPARSNPDGAQPSIQPASTPVNNPGTSTTQVTLLHTLQSHTDEVQSVSFSPDGRTLASGSNDRTLKLWDVASGQLLRTLQSHGNWVFVVAFSPDGRTLASAGLDKTIKLWDVASGQFLHTLQGHAGYVTSLAFSPDGRTLASGSADKTIKLWEVASGQLLRTLQSHTDAVWSVAFSPDGRTMAWGGKDGTIRLWEVASRQLLRTLQGHTNLVSYLAFSPDGRTLASGSADKTIKLWEVASGQLLHTLQGHTDSINSIALSPDGRTLASGSADKTIKLWDVAGGQLLRTLQGHTGGVTSVAFSPDGRTLASGSSDHTIKLWDVAGVNK
jgi:uncharacterized protein YjiK